jgi:hypothetical protein
MGLTMPYVSKAQQGFFHSPGAAKAGITKADVKHWDEASRGQHGLPEHVKKKESMANVVETLFAEGQLTPEQIEKVGERASAFLAGLEKDPELMKEALGLPDVDWKALMNRGLQAGAITMGGAAAMTLHDLVKGKIQDHQNDVAKAKAYKDMLASNPELSASHVDAEAVQRHFDTLHTFNPEYAQDPTVSGYYGQAAIEAASPNSEAINNRVKARAEMLRSQGEVNKNRQGKVHPIASAVLEHMKGQAANSQPRPLDNAAGEDW